LFIVKKGFALPTGQLRHRWLNDEALGQTWEAAMFKNYISALFDFADLSAKHCFCGLLPC